MFIRKIIEENQAGKDSEDIVSEANELIQVKEAVDRLNGETKTGVVLERDSDNFMVIGGGKNNKYVVYAQVKGRVYFMTNKFDVVKAPIEVIVAGRKGNYASKKCMNLEMALQAAKHFADRGVLAQTFNWENN
jgi:hypothetical protein